MSSLEERISNLVETEWESSIRSLPLSDETCDRLINSYLAKKSVPASSFLHICVSPTPCLPNEEEKTTNSRKWCKGRGLKMGTPKFDHVARELSEIYSYVEENREERLKKVSKELKSDLSDELAQLEKIKIPSTLPTDEISDIERRVEEFLESGKAGLENVKKLTNRLQEKKAGIEMGSVVLMATKESVKSVKSELKQKDTDRHLQKTLQQLTLAMGSIDARLKDMENQGKVIDKKQDALLDLVTAQDQRELQQYMSACYQSRLKALKMFALAPLKILSIVVWKPAKYAFWHFFGKYFYLLWGLLMLLLIVFVTVSVGVYFKQEYPSISSGVYEAGIYLWGEALRTGSLVAEHLRPWFTDGVIQVVSGVGSRVRDIGNRAIQALLDGILQIFKDILQSAITAVTPSWAKLW